jgi:hypothetical protein
VPEKLGLTHAVPAPAAPAVRAWDGAFVGFTVFDGLLNFGQGVFPPLLPQIIIAPGAVGWLIGRHGFRAAGLALAGLLVVATAVAIAALGRPPRQA